MATEERQLAAIMFTDIAGRRHHGNVSWEFRRSLLCRFPIRHFSPCECGPSYQLSRSRRPLREFAGPDRKDMLHPRGDRERGVDSSDAGIAHEADGVVEKDFIAPDETEQWRKSGEIGEDGRGKGLRGIGAVQISVQRQRMGQIIFALRNETDPCRSFP